jgi:hypothetical protein
MSKNQPGQKRRFIYRVILIAFLAGTLSACCGWQTGIPQCRVPVAF